MNIPFILEQACPWHIVSKGKNTIIFLMGYDYVVGSSANEADYGDEILPPGTRWKVGLVNDYTFFVTFDEKGLVTIGLLN